MFIDGLTITALLVFAVTVLLFVRFCVASRCGEPEGDQPGDSERHSRVNRP